MDIDAFLNSRRASIIFLLNNQSYCILFAFGASGSTAPRSCTSTSALAQLEEKSSWASAVSWWGHWALMLRPHQTRPKKAGWRSHGTIHSQFPMLRPRSLA